MTAFLKKAILKLRNSNTKIDKNAYYKIEYF